MSTHQKWVVFYSVSTLISLISKENIELSQQNTFEDKLFENFKIP